MRLTCALLGSIIERGRQIKKLDMLAFYDPLTGLANRAQFAAKIEALIAGKRRFALHYIDLDRFKKINDRYGRTAGDTVLKIAAARLRACARAEDLVVRLGGDEFAILQMVTTGRLESAQLAKRVVEAFAHPIDLGGIVVEVGASVGIAIRPRSTIEARVLIEAADAALYCAKRTGRGKYARAPSVGNGAPAEAAIEVLK